LKTPEYCGIDPIGRSMPPVMFALKTGQKNGIFSFFELNFCLKPLQMGGFFVLFLFSCRKGLKKERQGCML
jgi:hypothetical protein